MPLHGAPLRSINTLLARLLIDIGCLSVILCTDSFICKLQENGAPTYDDLSVAVSALFLALCRASIGDESTDSVLQRS